MNFVYGIFKKNPENREDIISVTSGIGIVMNIFIALSKIFIGFLVHSIAIISEGANNASDAMTFIVTFIGNKLAGKHPDEKHPFGYGRIEYLTGLVVSVLIIVTGLELLKSSVEMIFEPTRLSVTPLSVGIIIFSAIIKLLYGSYALKMSKKANSGALEAVGLDSRNDCIGSVITLGSALVFVVFHVSLDAYAGIITSLIIVKAGAGVLGDTISELIGRPGEKELALTLYREIVKTDGIIYAVDMMLHNYGPDAWSGSVNVELDHKMTVAEAYSILHALQMRIKQQYNVTMVFGVYSVDNDSPESREIRRIIGEYIKDKEHIKSFHAVWKDESEKKLYCDFLVDYKLRDWDATNKDFVRYMNEKYPGYEVILTIETEFV